MNAQDRLRSLRAKLAVLEGKMALAIMYPQTTFNHCHIYVYVCVSITKILTILCFSQGCTKNCGREAEED